MVFPLLVFLNLIFSYVYLFIVEKLIVTMGQIGRSKVVIGELNKKYRNCAIYLDIDFKNIDPQFLYWESTIIDNFDFSYLRDGADIF